MAHDGDMTVTSQVPKSRVSRSKILLGGALVLAVVVGVSLLLQESGNAERKGGLGFMGRLFFSLNEDTRFAPGYTESAFGSIKVGDTEAAVTNLLGAPLQTRTNEPVTLWVYASGPVPIFSSSGELGDLVDYTAFLLDGAGRIKYAHGQLMVASGLGTATFTVGDGQNFLRLSDAQIEGLKGKDSASLEASFGKPRAVRAFRAVKVLFYSDSPTGKNYRKRNIGIDASGKVVEVDDGFYFD